MKSIKRLKRTKAEGLPDVPGWDLPDFVPVADKLTEILRVDALELEELVALSLGLEREWATDDPKYKRWLFAAKLYFGSRGKEARAENYFFPDLFLVRPRDGFTWMRGQLGSLAQEVEDFFRSDEIYAPYATHGAEEKKMSQNVVISARLSAREENALETARVILGLVLYRQQFDALKEGSYGAWTFLPAFDNDGFTMPEDIPLANHYTRKKAHQHIAKALQVALGETKFSEEFPSLVEAASTLKN